MDERADVDHSRAMDDHTDAKDDRRNIRDDHDDLITIKTQVGQIKEIIDKIDRKLMGNGAKGICDIVNEHEVTLKNIKYGITLGFTIMTIIILLVNVFIS
jgi:hypothetical protein